MLTQLLEEFAGELEAVAVPANSEEAGELMNMILQGAWNETNDPNFLERAHAQLELTQSDLVVKRREVELMENELLGKQRELETTQYDFLVKSNMAYLEARLDDLVVKRGEVEERQREVEAVWREVEERQREEEERQRKVEAMRRAVEERQRKEEAIQRMLEEEQRKVEERQRMLEEEQRKVEERQRRLEAIQRGVEEERRKVEALQREVEALQREVEEEQRKVEALQREVEALQREEEEERRELEAMQREVEEERRKLEAMQREVEEERREVEADKESLEEERRKVEERQRELETRHREMEASQEDLVAVQLLLKFLNKDVELGQNEVQKKQREVELMRLGLTEKQSDLAEKQREEEEEQSILKELNLRIVLTYISIWESKFGEIEPNLAGIADYSLLIRGFLASNLLLEELANPLVIIMKELSRAGEHRLDLSNSRVAKEKIELLLLFLPGTTIKVINFTGVEISDELLAVLTEGLKNTDVVEIEGIEPNPELRAVLAENATRVVAHSEHSSDFGGEEPADIDPNSPSAVAVAGNGADMLDPAMRPDLETAAKLAEQTRRTEELEAQMRDILRKLEESQKDPIKELKSKKKQRAQKREERIQQELDDLRAQLAATQDKVADLSRAREEELKNLRKDISGVVGGLLGENPNKNIVQLKAELKEKLQALEDSLSSGIGANQRALDDLDKRTKKNEKSLEDINMSDAPQAWLDLQDRHLVKYAPNNNAKKYKDAFCKRLGHLFRGFENIESGLLPQLSLPWDLEEATSAKDMHEGAVEAMAAGVNFVDAVCSQFPLIAAGSKALVAFCNHYRLKKEQVKSDIILSAIPTPEAMSEIARHLSIFLARHHAKHVFNNLSEEVIYEGWRAKLINSNSRFLRFFKPIASIGRRIESKNVLAEELGQADANKAMIALLASAVVDKSHSVETIMLSGIGYDDGDREKWRGVRALDYNEKTEHSHFVSELYKAIGKRADRAAGYFVSASMPTSFPPLVDNSQVAASAAAALKQGAAPAAVLGGNNV
jgi:hypothetical protein